MAKPQNISYHAVIYTSLLGIVEKSFHRQDINLKTEFIWNKLRPYISDDLERKWKEQRRETNHYKASMGRVRVIMLSLYQIELLPRSNVQNEELRVYSDFEPKYGETSDAHIASELNYSDIMMRYWFLLDELVNEGMDIDAINYMCDVGWAFVSPYVTYEDREDWRQANDIRSFLGAVQWAMKKVGIISTVLDREGVQFSRRAVDQMGMGEGLSAKTMIQPYIEGVKDIDDDLNINDDGKIIIKEDDDDEYSD